MWVILLLMSFPRSSLNSFIPVPTIPLEPIFISLSCIKTALLYINWSTMLSSSKRLGERWGLGQGWVADLNLWRTRYFLTLIIKLPLYDLKWHCMEVQNKVFQTIILQAYVTRGYSWLCSCTRLLLQICVLPVTHLQMALKLVVITDLCSTSYSFANGFEVGCREIAPLVYSLPLWNEVKEGINFLKSTGTPCSWFFYAPWKQVDQLAKVP